MVTSLIVTGHAGSGKSLLTEKFSAYLERMGYRVARTNLDPASPPRYPADWDIRRFVKTEEVMASHSLGINGALLKSMEIGIGHLKELKVNDSYDFVIYDTPGQLELFVFTEFGKTLVKCLEPGSVCIFLVDSSRIGGPINYAAAVSQSAVVSMMLGIPAVTAFNKTDVIEIRELEYYMEKIKDEGVLGEYFEALLRFVELTSTIYRPLRISTKTERGFYELYTALNEVFCACGDLS